MNAHADWDETKNVLSIFLEQKINEYRVTFGQVNHWGTDVFERINTVISSGKLIRGTLFLQTAYALGINEKHKILPIAAAFELLQLSLLIHDDIMDHDQLRRGNVSFWKQYQDWGEKNFATHPYHSGISLAICSGDIGFFLSFLLINEADISTEQKKQLLSLYSSELTKVGLAQMEDMRFSQTKYEPTREEIIDMYTVKTARYTFSVPLMSAAIVTNQTSELYQILEKIGVLLGINFQLQDDFLGIFGDPEHTGKPIGNDLIENKKTVLRKLLLQTPAADLITQFTSQNSNASLLIKIREIYEADSIKHTYEGFIETNQKKINLLLSSLSEEKELCNLLTKLIQKLQSRIT